MVNFFNPLCGFSLKHGAKGIAIFDLLVVFSLVLLRFYSFDVYLFETDMEEAISNLNLKKLGNENHQEQVEQVFRDLASYHYANHIFMSSIIGIVIIGADIWLSCKLWRASNSENASALSVWLVGRTLFIGLFYFLCGLLIYESIPQTILTSFLVVANTTRFFGLFVVNELRKQILATGTAQRI